MRDKLNIKLLNRAILIVLIMLVYLFLQYVNIVSMIDSLLITLLPFYIGFFLCWMLLPLSNLFQKKLKIGKTVANGISLLLSIIVLLIIFLIIIPLAFVQAGDLFQQLPEFFNGLMKNLGEFLPIKSLEYDTIYKEVYKRAGEIGFDKVTTFLQSPVGLLGDSLKTVVVYMYNVFNFILTMVVGYVIAFYFMGSIKNFTKATVKLFSPNNFQKYINILKQMSDSLYGYLKGMFIVCTMVGVMIGLGAAALGIKSPVILGLISAITNIIPYLGPILGGIPLVLIALSQSIWHAVAAIVLIMVVQFVESQFFQPRIMSKSTDLHPVTIMVSLLIFSSMFGFIGMIVATPIMTMINVAIKNSKYKDKIKL